MAALERMKVTWHLIWGDDASKTVSTLKLIVTSDDFILPLIRKGSRMNCVCDQPHDEHHLNSLGANEYEVSLEARVSFIRQTRPYVTIVLESGNPFICRCVVGPLLFHYDFNGQHHVLFFPQLSVKNSQNQPLIQVLRKIQS